MKPVIIEMSQMSDSREVMEHKIFPAGVIFIYSLLITIILALVWSYFGEIDVVVKARGQIKPSTQIHTLKNKTTGTVTEVKIKNGMFVKSGDILYSVDKESLQLKLQNAMNDLSEVEQEILLIKDFEHAITTKSEIFNSIDSARFESLEPTLINKYKSDFEQHSLNEVQSLQAIKFVKKKIVQSEQNLAGYKEILKKLDDSNKIEDISTSGSIYDLKLVTYMTTLSQKQLNLNDKKLELERNTKLFESGAISKTAFDTSENAYNLLNSDLRSYKAQFRLEIEQYIDSAEIEIAQYESELNKLKSTSIEGVEVSANEVSKLLNLSLQLQNKQNQQETLKENIKVLNDQLKNSDIKSPFDGYVNLDVELSPGDFVESGKFVGSIIPESGSELRLQLNVPNKEIADIKVGDEVKCRIDALSYKEYGMVVGNVTRISPGSIGNPDSNNGYYIIEATLPNEKLTSYKGDQL